jgi:hypothetical protein
VPKSKTTLQLTWTIDGVPTQDELKFDSKQSREFALEALNLVTNAEILAAKAREMELNPSNQGESMFLEDFSIFVATWNMGDSLPCDNLQDLLFVNGRRSDIYAIGVQECSYKSLDGGSTAKHLTRQFEINLGPEYYLVKRVSLSDIRLFIFAKKIHCFRISEVEVSKEACMIYLFCFLC